MTVVPVVELGLRPVTLKTVVGLMTVLPVTAEDLIMVVPVAEVVFRKAAPVVGAGFIMVATFGDEEGIETLMMDVDVPVPCEYEV